MIEAEKRKAIYESYKSGKSTRTLSEFFSVNQKTIMKIIDQEGMLTVAPRKTKIDIDENMLRKLYKKCDGWVQRIYEILEEEYKINIAYSTLTQKIRELGLKNPGKKRCSQVPDQPGEEMQHDTSIYIVKIDNVKTKVVASILYFRYSKIRYLKFFHRFNRFKMKCFFHEALSHIEYAAKQCIIDNTNLARLRGSGKYAVIVPEMENFGKQYGFEFICHAINHSNRKAGNERSFYTLESNFFPGRTFKSMEDLNKQAFEWSTVKIANRPVGKSRIIPARIFEHEQEYLIPLMPSISAPYLSSIRIVDQYGYVSVNGNYYLMPENIQGEIQVVEYSDHFKVFVSRALIIEYKLPAEDVKGKRYTAKGISTPKRNPKYSRNASQAEEAKLKALGDDVEDYLNFAIKEKSVKQKHKFIKHLYSLKLKIAPELFLSTIKRAFKYKITKIQTIERIAILQLNDKNTALPYIEIDEEFKNRDAYLEGQLSDDVDLSIYDKLGGDCNDG